MLILIWFFRLVALPFGLACAFVALDMLHMWGLGSSRPRRTFPRGSRTSTATTRVGYVGGKLGGRPHDRAWVWWKWEIRHPAWYLLALGIALIGVWVLVVWPGYGPWPWVSDRVAGIALLVLGLILLRGTLKITSPLLWQKITIIKRPFDGKAHPSVPWMAVGLVLCLASVYGLACKFTSPAVCFSGATNIWGVVLKVAEFLFCGIGAIGLEGVIQALQDREPIPALSWLVFGVGVVGFIAVLIVQALP
jgi:hypothetical protein